MQRPEAVRRTSFCVPAEIDEVLVRSLSSDRRLTADDRLVEDLALDSISILELLLVVEELVGHELSFEFVATWSTLGDLKLWPDSAIRGDSP